MDRVANVPPPTSAADGPATPVDRPSGTVLLDALACVPERLLLDRLRDVIDEAVFTGRLAPGDPLPGIPVLARRTGLDPNVVRRCVRALVREGRVEVRSDAGLHVPGGFPEDGEDAWLVEVVAAARRHGMAPLELSRRLARPYLGGIVRALCVAARSPWRNRALVELRAGFGIEARATTAAALEEPDGETILHLADLVVTTPFDAPTVRRAALSTGAETPVVVAALPGDCADRTTSPPFGASTTRDIARILLSAGTTAPARATAARVPQRRDPVSPRRRARRAAHAAAPALHT